MVTQEIDLNLIPSSEPVVVHLNQYDEGYHRLICHLYAGAVPYEPVSPTVKVQGTKPDKHGFQYYCDIDGSTAYVDINLQMTACMGRVPTQLIVTESTGVTGSFAFELDVQESALVLDVDISETDIPIITEEAQEAARRSEQSAEQSAASAAEAAAWSSNPPYIGENLHWYVYDIQSEEFVDSGVVAEGKDGSLWYRGTAVYGKSLVPTIFDTDIEYAHTSDMYLNTTEGAIYHCVTPGADTVATWVYDMTLSGGGGGGTDNYNDLTNQPSIGGVTLIGNKTIAELGGVQSFNGRSGSILPVAGDYTGSQVSTSVTVGGAAQTTVDGALTALDGSIESLTEEMDEFTSSITQTNDSVVFDDLNPDYGYKICFDDQGATGDLTVPTWTSVTKATGTNSTVDNPLIKLTYTISGGTNGTSKFALRILK